MHSNAVTKLEVSKSSACDLLCLNVPAVLNHLDPLTQTNDTRVDVEARVTSGVGRTSGWTSSGSPTAHTRFPKCRLPVLQLKILDLLPILSLSAPLDSGDPQLLFRERDSETYLSSRTLSIWTAGRSNCRPLPRPRHARARARDLDYKIISSSLIFGNVRAGCLPRTLTFQWLKGTLTFTHTCHELSYRHIIII